MRGGYIKTSHQFFMEQWRLLGYHQEEAVVISERFSTYFRQKHSALPSGGSALALIDL